MTSPGTTMETPIRVGAPHSHYNVLGVNISALTLDRAANLIEAWVAADARQYVNVCTSGTVLECHDHPHLAGIVNAAGMATPDGMPLVWLGRWRGFDVSRVYGHDLMLKLSDCGQIGRASCRERV